MARLVGDRATRFHPAAIVILGLCLGLLPVLVPGLGCLSPRPRSGFEVPPPFSSVTQEEPGDSDQRPPTAPAPLALPEGLDEISIELGGEGEPTLENSREINLRQVLDEALAGNINLALARAEEKVAEGRVSVAVGRFLPSIDLGAVARFFIRSTQRSVSREDQLSPSEKWNG